MNCAGLNATFLDSELFGHEKGAFTDAKDRKQGLFEISDHGTIFLDEIGDLAPELQPKLLKVLETKTFRRLGGTREITVDVRLIAATNKNLQSEVEDGRFREDLYYRLSVMPLTLPAVRDRSREDRLSLITRILVGPAGRAARRTADALERGAGAAARLSLARQRARDAERAGARADSGPEPAGGERGAPARASSARGPASATGATRRSASRISSASTSSARSSTTPATAPGPRSSWGSPARR